MDELTQGQPQLVGIPPKKHWQRVALIAVTILLSVAYIVTNDASTRLVNQSCIRASDCPGEQLCKVHPEDTEALPTEPAGHIVIPTLVLREGARGYCTPNSGIALYIGASGSGSAQYTADGRIIVESLAVDNFQAGSPQKAIFQFALFLSLCALFLIALVKTIVALVRYARAGAKSEVLPNIDRKVYRSTALRTGLYAVGVALVILLGIF